MRRRGRERKGGEKKGRKGRDFVAVVKIH